MTDSTTPADDVWTVQRILLWTTDFLKQKGIESARLEAELLLAHARNCPRILLYTEFETPLTTDERSRMRELVKRRAAREPLAYITGHKEFYGRDFVVGPGVLVPRPETETLIDVCLDQIPKDQPTTVCEVGFGSGCIAITLAKQRPKLSLIATDISPAAMNVAAQNVETHKVADRVQLRAGAGFEPMVQAGVVCDGIVSNPPYIREDELAGLSPEVAKHEPVEALVSGPDGLTLTRQLISKARGLLKPGGWMILELDPAQCETVRQLFMEAGFETTRIHKDLSGHDRIVEARLAEAES
ncbi:MAG: peptide chain release factor N(5)-glutamine methyltransferase [Planctomycetaceae bacterium]